MTALGVIQPAQYLALGALLFTTGVAGVLLRKNSIPVIWVDDEDERHDMMKA